MWISSLLITAVLIWISRMLDLLLVSFVSCRSHLSTLALMKSLQSPPWYTHWLWYLRLRSHVKKTVSTCSLCYLSYKASTHPFQDPFSGHWWITETQAKISGITLYLLKWLHAAQLVFSVCNAFVNHHAIAVMFVRLSVCPTVCLSVLDGHALWSYEKCTFSPMFCAPWHQSMST